MLAPWEVNLLSLSRCPNPWEASAAAPTGLGESSSSLPRYVVATFFLMLLPVFLTFH